jgi:glutamate carboxypeptidase
MRFFLLPLLSILALSTVVQADASSERERALGAAVDSRTDAALELLERAVNINSGTMNFAGVQRVGEVFMREFEALGFEVEWLPGESFRRAGHVVARRHRDGPRVLLVGHLDTVFPADSEFQRFEILDPETARGPGTTDMKGGNVIMLEALRALDTIGALDDLSVTAVLTGDEETAGEPLALARKALIDAAVWADYAIGFEDGDSNPETAVVARRGAVDWELTVTGKPAHSSQVFQPEYGYGAIYEAARILDAFRVRLEDMELLTVNPGIISGGTSVDYEPGNGGTARGKYNVIAETLRASGDLRTISPAQLDEARDAMRTIVADNLPHTAATIDFGEGYPPMAASEGNMALLKMYDTVSRDLGFGPVRAVDPRNAGAADISFTAEHVAMAIDGVGLMGSGGHTVDETADLRTLPMQAKRAAVLLLRLSEREIPRTP